ncbi:hypothetical protein K0M31_006510 [Melipona bicolor]|uniref:Secreted protein n=1 Tax=Melipona bicolor TaxID=60889 RepID=A0AA40KLT8_9HYME|nr:hypothetical protein K0M31_006510 [Melipona bicolor]
MGFIPRRFASLLACRLWVMAISEGIHGESNSPVEKYESPLNANTAILVRRWSAKFAYQKGTSSNEDPLAWREREGNCLGAFFGEISGSFSIIRVNLHPGQALARGENFLDAVRFTVSVPLNFKFDSVAVSRSHSQSSLYYLRRKLHCNL